MFFIKNKKKAFTLIELIISLFLISLLITLATINYDIGFSEANLSNSQAILFQNIKTAQNNALSYKSYNDVSPVYWGIYLATGSSEFIFFADLDGDGKYDNGEADPLYGGNTISLSKGVTINDLSWDVSAISILFEYGTGIMTIFNIDIDDFDDYYWLIELKDGSFDLGYLLIVEPPAKSDVQICSCSDISKYCCSFCSSTTSCLDFEAP